MNKIKSYIVLVILGLFVFPVVFQSLHNIWHHSHCCQDEHLFCSDATIYRDFQKDRLSLPEKNNYCPICEYKFPINSLPDFLIIEIIIQIFIGNFTETIQKQPHQKLFTLKVPRAPPFHNIT